MDKSRVIGVDIGTATVKVFSGAITSEQDIAIDSIGIVQSVGLDKGLIYDYGALARSIRQAVDCAASEEQLAISNIYIGLGGMDIRSANCLGSVAPLSPNAITDEDIERACRSAVLAGIPNNRVVLHTRPLCFWVDQKRQLSSPIGQQGFCLEVETHIITAPEEGINELLKYIQGTGLNISGVVASGFVGAEALMTNIEVDQGIILDIGAGTTEISLFQDGTIYHFASLPLGGNYITRDIMKALEINEQHAEGVKRYYSRLDSAFHGQTVILDCNDYGTTDKQVHYDFLSKVIESRVDEIVVLIHDHIVKTLRISPIKQIFLTGGCSAMPSFSIALKKCFEANVQVRLPDKLLAEYAYPNNTACFGIMVHGAKQVAKNKQNSANYLWRSILKNIKKLF